MNTILILSLVALAVQIGSIGYMLGVFHCIRAEAKANKAKKDELSK